uniref:Putative lateral signaling target protein 2 n=1 Tax=Ixodes ricinus TaxID=34613 RepID=A0A0K8R6D9_IXORI
MFSCSTSSGNLARKSSVSTGVRNGLIHNFVADAQDPVLADPELVDQGGTAIRVFPAIKAVEFGSHQIEFLVSPVELCQGRGVLPLGSIKPTLLQGKLQYLGQPYYLRTT